MGKDAFEKEKPAWLAPVLVVGIWTSFLLFGWATEALTRSKYTYTDEDGVEVTEKFKFTSLMTFTQCIFNSVVAIMILIFNHGFKFSFLAGVPLHNWLIVAGGLFGAHKFGYGALAYIPFSLQVMVKSAKTVPVLIGDVLIAGAKPPFHKVVEVLMLTSGITWFLYHKPSSKASGSFEIDSETLFGMGMAMMALCCDGVYGPYQNKIVKEYGPSSWHLMLNANFWQMLMCIPFILMPSHNGVNELQLVIDFADRHPVVYSRLLLFALTMACGQATIYIMARNFGALTVTLTTTARKFFSVLLSSAPPPFGMGNTIAPLQYVGMVGVFGSKLVSKAMAPAKKDVSKKNDKQKKGVQKNIKQE